MEKIPKHFNLVGFPKTPPCEGEAIILLADVLGIKPVELPEVELQYARLITHEVSRKRYLAGRYLVRGALARWLDISPSSIPLELSLSGKPFLPSMDLHFSISHTGKVVAVVFSSLEAGIDLEQERSVDMGALARRFFSPDEAMFLQKSDSLADFFQLWCAREAAIKADGRGLGQLLASTEVILTAAGLERELSVQTEGREWRSFSWILRGALHGAVAFSAPPCVIRWCDLRDALS